MTDRTTNQDDMETRSTEPSETDAGASTDGSLDAESETDQGGDIDAGVRADDAQSAADVHDVDPHGVSSGASPDDEVETLKGEFDTLNDRHLRLVAEFNNFRRRSEQERMSAWARAQADLVGSLLDVLDDLQRVADLDLSNASVEAIMEGIDLVERKFMRQLVEAGVDVVDPVGEPFDPERMEAMMRVPPEADEQVDTVAQVFQKGYSLKGTLIRPARVSVYTQG